MQLAKVGGAAQDPRWRAVEAGAAGEAGTA